MRVFFYFDPINPSRWFPVFYVRDTQPGSVLSYEMDLLPTGTGQRGAPSWFRWLYVHGGDYDTVESAFHDRVPLGAWSCWELELRGDSGQVAFSLDDHPMSSLTKTGWPAPASAALSFGARITHDDTVTHPDGFNVWIDEIIVSDRAIGCTR